MKRTLVQAVVLILALGIVLPSSVATGPGLAAGNAPATTVSDRAEYVVLYAEGAPPAAVRTAIKAAGGIVVSENVAVGVATVRASGRNHRDFLAAIGRQPALAGAARSLPIGQASARTRLTIGEAADESARPDLPGYREAGLDERGNGGPQAGADPLAPQQWDMRLIRATREGSYSVQAGDKAVLVGVIDTGVDGNHPDIAPNFSRELSRNFTTDRPEFDGPCEVPSCVDPPDVDDDGHGTHVAGTIAAPLNGLGMAGVAPNVTLVNLRAGQDSGLFFLQPTVDALTYAGDIGVDVVNMSYYIDPWLYNCTTNPSPDDSPQAQEEQRTIVAATQRALDYARARGVTLVAAAGNGHTDLGRPTLDESSPSFPEGAARPRRVDNSCLSMPSEGRGVIGVTSVGPSGRKAVYSDYGVEQADIAAPGGDSLDYFGTPQYQPVTNRILAPYPRALLERNREIDANGNPTPNNGRLVVRDCRGGVCAYYRYLEGTSMAAPHATGVAALIVSQYGVPDRRRPGGLTLRPARVEQILKGTATDTPCPDQQPFTYPGLPRTTATSYNAICEGDARFNGFFGEGVVDALRAVGGGERPRR
ncbi:MAG: Secreted subtilisin-like protease [uncultured Thermomicrobiales bacterium]|uniref:Secreted subtilisin-like protease n=1 Tax=uncultured Thermomicrobiales bacterium TaxID=1645740 RepID=A0A6J4V6N6_9BACT|nr:MAG: Secreted subtilisin-like protease [uncultured Thermomicrobiales bacterium]